MATAATYTSSGTKAKTAAKLPASVFGVTVKDHTLLQQAYLAHLANRRANPARVKTRSEVRGGGRKPWRQKGTGRARAGSIRSPIWRGGGITFGPTGSENHARKLTKRAKRLAMVQALSLKAHAKAILLLEDFSVKEGKVKETQALLTKVKADRNILLVVEQKSDLIDRATRNLPNVTLRSARHLNTFVILNADQLLITKPALKTIESLLGVGKAGANNV